MATYRLCAQVIGRCTGRTSTAAAAYRAGVAIEDARTGLTHDYTRRSGVVAAYILAPESAPAWASDRSALWNRVEAIERRIDAQLCREVQLSLPHELDDAQRRALLDGFVREQWVDAGMVADVAIHRPDDHAHVMAPPPPPPPGDARNDHAHVMLTLREIGPEGFGNKVRAWNTTPLLESWREAWAEHTNRALERAGVAARVDHRTLVAQRADAVDALDAERADELDRMPQPKLGPVPAADLRRSRATGRPVETGRAAEFVAVETANTERAGVLRQWRSALRAVSAVGVAAFGQAFDAMQAGIAAFAAKANDWAIAQNRLEQAREFAAALRREQQAAAALPPPILGPDLDLGRGFSR